MFSSNSEPSVWEFYSHLTSEEEQRDCSPSTMEASVELLPGNIIAECVTMEASVEFLPGNIMVSNRGKQEYAPEEELQELFNKQKHNAMRNRTSFETKSQAMSEFSGSPGSEGCGSITTRRRKDLSKSARDRGECADLSQRPRYDSGASYFRTMITPVSSLRGQHTNTDGMVEFKMRRKNKAVTLQWEAFSGIMGASGVAFLTVTQVICNTPPYPIMFPVCITYKGQNRSSALSVEPGASLGNIKFYINADRSTNNVASGDAFNVCAGAVTWIVD